MELKLAKGTEEIDAARLMETRRRMSNVELAQALRLHVDWLEDALQSAKQAGRGTSTERQLQVVLICPAGLQQDGRAAEKP